MHTRNRMKSNFSEMHDEYSYPLTFFPSPLSVLQAIFPRDGGMEAPSCVVGFQFSHELLYDRFMEITSKVKVSLVVPFKRFASKILSSISVSAKIA